MVKETKAKASKKQEEEYFEDGDDALSINLDAVEGQSFEAIPKGVYDVVLEELEFKMSASSGKPMWSIIFVITSGEYKGRKIFHNMSFSEGALPGTKAALLRFAPEVISAGFKPKAIADSGKLIGKTARVKTKLEKYNDEDQTRIASFLPAKASDGFSDE